MKRLFLLLLSLSFMGLSSFAKAMSGSLKFRAEVNNYAEYQNRTGYTDETGLYYLLPCDKLLNQVNMDLRAISSLKYFNVVSKLGLDWSGFKYHNMEIGASMDGDFYLSSGSSPILRLRKAFLTAGWDFNRWGKLVVKAGQDLHPFAEDKPFTLSLSSGAPFNPFSYAPALRASYSYFGVPGIDRIGLDLAALWQTDFRSNGPSGYSSEYIQRACCPELFAGLNATWRFLTFKAGADLLTIKPRTYGVYPYTSVVVFVNDNIQTFSSFAYLEARFKKLTLKAKTVLSEAGEHLLLMSGYGVDHCDSDGNHVYTPYRSSSSWLSANYEFVFRDASSLSVGMMAGYIKNLGTKAKLLSSDSSYIFYNNGANNLKHAFRFSPSVTFRFKALKLGAEYEFTGANYGKNINLQDGLPSTAFSWVFSNRLSIVIGCSF